MRLSTFFSLAALIGLLWPCGSYAEDAGLQLMPHIPLKLKPGEPINQSDHWVLLNPEASAVFEREEKQEHIRLTGNARLRSRDVSSYPSSLGLFAEWLITNQTGAMGFGFIDFSTSIYYYLYEDADKGEWILQRGDGTTTKQLASGPVQPGNTRKFQLNIRTGPVMQFDVLLNGTPVAQEISDRPPQELGSTFQLYIGSGNGAEVLLGPLSTVPAGKRKESGGWFW